MDVQQILISHLRQQSRSRSKYKAYVRMRRRNMFRSMQRMLIRQIRRRKLILMTWLLELQNQGRIYRGRQAWVLTRDQFWFENNLNNGDDQMWKEHFRVSKRTFDFICDLVRPELSRQNTRLRLAIPLEKRVAVAIWRLATGNLV